jgi:thiamine biosynthesis lipoprotein
MHSLMQSSQHSPRPQSNDVIRTVALMGTFVTIHVVGHVVGHVEGHVAGHEVGADTTERERAVDRALDWFHKIEECCTRFEASSEAMRLATQVGVPVRVSTILFEAVQFALAVAEESEGAFDPTVGYAMESLGFNREYRTGQTIRTLLDSNCSVSYRDVCLGVERQTITLLRPLILDLGAVAKGLAVDLAARELQSFNNFAINAGGDLYLGGCNPTGEPWSIGIRHPRKDGELIDSIRVSNRAVCTSGDYEKRAAAGEQGHHILDPRTGSSANAVASVTVIAPTAMLADALATAAFVLGPADGIRLFHRLGVDGLIISPTLELYATRGFREYH